MCLLFPIETTRTAVQRGGPGSAGERQTAAGWAIMREVVNIDDFGGGVTSGNDAFRYRVCPAIGTDEESRVERARSQGFGQRSGEGGERGPFDDVEGGGLVINIEGLDGSGLVSK